MKKLRRLGPVLSSPEASTASLWLWSRRNGEGGWGCRAQQRAGWSGALKSANAESGPHPRRRIAASVHEAGTPTNASFPPCPGSLSWDVSRRRPGWSGMEPSVFRRGEACSRAGTTAARAYERVPGSRLRAGVRSCCPASGKTCLVGGEPQVYIPWSQMRSLCWCKIRQGQWRLTLAKPGSVLVARTEARRGDQWAC